MKLFLVAFAVIAVVAADVSHLASNEYLPPVQEQAVHAAPAAPAQVYQPAPAVAPSNDYLPPVQQQQLAEQSVAVEEAAPAHELAADGYRYKTHRRVVYRRNRRDVSHLPSNEYLPPVQQQEQQSAPVQEVQVLESAPVEQISVAVEEAAPAHELAADGYRYKTHRRVVYRRNRRDVSHLASNEYLPPVQEQAAQAAPAAPAQVYQPAPAVVPSNDYLPPVQQQQLAEQSVAVEEAAPAHELAADGYRYKSHRRVVYRRNRRDVSHLPSNEYLPPVQQEQQQSAPIQQAQVLESAPVEQIAVAVEEAAPAHELAADGYRYKTNRRVVYRRTRRDVSHLASNEYLPPVQQQEQQSAPIQEVQVLESAPVQEIAVQEVAEAAPAHELAADGYRYKTHRRVVYRRNRRDVSHLPSNEYLPPVQQQEQQSAPIQEIQVQESTPVEHVAVEEAVPAHELADDGYRYKTHRRVVYRRNRRDVSHLPSNEYLPPVQQQEQQSAPIQEIQVLQSAPVQEIAVQEIAEAAPAHELAADGYRYKTNRRVVYRRNRRDVSHLPSNEYLPPVQQQEQSLAAAIPAPSYQAAPAQIVEEPVVVSVQEEAEPAHQLADDGYRYKTHRRVVYRRNRRDVSHLASSEYLPPVQEQAAPAAQAPVYQPAPAIAPSNDYLPPVQQQQQLAEQTVIAEEAAPAHELAADGYRYKTHRRVVYRRH